MYLWRGWKDWVTLRWFICRESEKPVCQVSKFFSKGETQHAYIHTNAHTTYIHTYAHTHIHTHWSWEICVCRISLKANMNGEIEIGTSTEMAFMTNYWKDLPIHLLGMYACIYAHTALYEYSRNLNWNGLYENQWKDLSIHLLGMYACIYAHINVWI